MDYNNIFKYDNNYLFYKYKEDKKRLNLNSDRNSKYNDIKSISIDKINKIKEKINNNNNTLNKNLLNSDTKYNNLNKKLNNKYTNGKNTTNNWKNMNINLIQSKKPKTCYNNFKNNDKLKFTNKISSKEKESNLDDSEVYSQNIFFKKSEPAINNFNTKKEKLYDLNVKNDYDKNFLKIKNSIYDKGYNNISHDKPYNTILKNITLLNTNELFKLKHLIESKLNRDSHKPFIDSSSNNETNNKNYKITFNNNIQETENDYEETDKSWIEIKKEIEIIENNYIKF